MYANSDNLRRSSRPIRKYPDTASAPLDNPVHPKDLLATIYHSMGIDPHQLMYNHLNQPRELVQGDVVQGILQ